MAGLPCSFLPSLGDVVPMVPNLVSSLRVLDKRALILVNQIFLLRRRTAMAWSSVARLGEVARSLDCASTTRRPDGVHPGVWWGSAGSSAEPWRSTRAREVSHGGGKAQRCSVVGSRRAPTRTIAGQRRLGAAQWQGGTDGVDGWRP
jgi:hypothetical protein